MFGWTIIIGIILLKHAAVNMLFGWDDMSKFFIYIWIHDVKYMQE